MANWPAKTWKTGEFVTTQMMNDIRDELNELHSLVAVDTLGWVPVTFSASKLLLHCQWRDVDGRGRKRVDEPLLPHREHGHLARESSQYNDLWSDGVIYLIGCPTCHFSILFRHTTGLGKWDASNTLDVFAEYNTISLPATRWSSSWQPRF